MTDQIISAADVIKRLEQENADLRFALEAAQTDRNLYGDSCQEYRNDIQSLRADLARAKETAERYRAALVSDNSTDKRNIASMWAKIEQIQAKLETARETVQKARDAIYHGYCYGDIAIGSAKIIANGEIILGVRKSLDEALGKLK